MLARAKIPLHIFLTSLFLAFSISSGIAQYTVTVMVQATAGDAPSPSTWTDSGIVLAPGQMATIWASGSASWNAGNLWSGPEGTTADAGCGTRPCRDPSDPLPGASIGSLVGKIGDGPAFYVGTGPVTVAGTGRLLFAYQDGYGDHSNNQGYYTVTIATTIATTTLSAVTLEPRLPIAVTAVVAVGMAVLVVIAFFFLQTRKTGQVAEPADNRARYVEYLGKLQELKSRGEVSEETYRKLKDEYWKKFQKEQ